MKLTRDQIRSLRGQIKWMQENPIPGQWPQVRVMVCAEPTAITFMARSGLLEEPGRKPKYRGTCIGQMNTEGRKLVNQLRK